ncbi:hypothetical protein [Brucella intermedia]|uniref:hypothetical protein n=1 Tax=Brucella intermedia TaxID=94625 RepID=UPI001FFE7B6C|nr:hypothetical protein [Brucella intermedia]
MIIRATFNNDGFATGFYPENVWPDGYPEDAIEITQEDWRELLNNSANRRWDGSKVIEYKPPAVKPVTIIPAVTLWERMTDAEAEQVNAAMATQPFRTRQIFLTANTFRSDHELWPLLVQMAIDLFGEARAAELLSPA